MDNICINCIELNSKIISLECNIDELINDNQELKNRIAILEFDKIKHKIINAIQDIYLYKNLDKITIIKNSLFKLRKLGNNYNHYIDEDYNEYEINCKQLYLLYKLNKLSNNEKNIINNIFTKDEDLINEIIKYLDININKNIKMNKDILFDIESWWNY